MLWYFDRSDKSEKLHLSSKVANQYDVGVDPRRPRQWGIREQEDKEISLLSKSQKYKRSVGERNITCTETPMERFCSCQKFVIILKMQKTGNMLNNWSGKTSMFHWEERKANEVGIFKGNTFENERHRI